MCIRTPAQRPVVFPLRFLDGKVVDAGDAPPHEAAVVELPVFVVIRPEPVSCMIMPLIRKSNGDAVVVKRP